MTLAVVVVVASVTFPVGHQNAMDGIRIMTNMTHESWEHKCNGNFLSRFGYWRVK